MYALFGGKRVVFVQKQTTTGREVEEVRGFVFIMILLFWKYIPFFSWFETIASLLFSDFHVAVWHDGVMEDGFEPLRWNSYIQSNEWFHETDL